MFADAGVLAVERESPFAREGEGFDGESFQGEAKRSSSGRNLIFILVGLNSALECFDNLFWKMTEVRSSHKKI